MQKQTARWIGYLALATAQACVGFNVVSGKFLTGYFPIFLLLATRCLIGLIAMLGVAATQKIYMPTIIQRFSALSMRDKIGLLIQAACGCFLFNVFILYGMQSTSATAAGIISSITPIMAFLFAAVLLREKITPKKWLAVVLVVVGLMVLSVGEPNGTQSSTWIGNGLVFMAVIPEAMFTVLSKSMGQKLSHTETVIWVNVFNLLLFLPLALYDLTNFQIATITPTIWGIWSIYGISGGVLFFFLWYKGLERISANTAALFTGVMPVSTTVLAAIFLKEIIHATDLVGMGLVLLAIAIGCHSGRKAHV